MLRYVHTNIIANASPHKINQCGLAHLAFEVDDVEETDIEGNVLELQSWGKQ